MKVGFTVLLMKMKFVPFFFIIVAAVLIHACEYEPAEIYERPANRSIPPPEIELVDINIDLDSDNGSFYFFSPDWSDGTGYILVIKTL